MRILFCHTNHPGQFGAFGAWLAQCGWDVVFATGRRDATPPRGARMFHFDAATDGAPETHRHARGLDRALRTAEAFAAVALKAQAKGIDPQIVVAHSGWGAGSYARAVWPQARFIPYVEWWYDHPRPDIHPDDPVPEGASAVAAARARAAARNAAMLVDLAQADAALCPSRFQASQFPPWLRDRLLIAPDGVDAASFAPDPDARARLTALGVPADGPLVTYATRGMEPYRGFPEFMRALAHLQRERPTLRAVIAGEDRVAYGAPLVAGDSWKKRMLDELDLDLDRITFTGLLGPEDYRSLLQASDLHVYLTIPFVLSWSLLEAMSVGCPLVSSDVAPVREAIADSDGAALVNHHDASALVAAMAAALDAPEAAQARGARARARIRAAYDRAWLWPARAAELKRLYETPRTKS